MSDEEALSWNFKIPSFADTVSAIASVGSKLFGIQPAEAATLNFAPTGAPHLVDDAFTRSTQRLLDSLRANPAQTPNSRGVYQEADGTIVVVGKKLNPPVSGSSGVSRSTRQIPADVVSAARASQRNWNVPASVSIAQWV